MAVGAVTFVEPSSDEEANDFAEPAPAPDAAEDILEISDTLSETTINIPEDNFEPDYDPRGGDDAVSLPPLEVLEADRVILTEGTAQDDLFDGDQGNDRARGLDGDDVLNGGAGNDALRGDGGDDTLGGDTGNDTLDGLDGTDLIRGGDQDDVLFGNNDDDALFGDTGNDALQGSAGNDILEGGAGDDTLQGGLDDDTLVSGAGADVLFGGWGNDVLNGLLRDANGGDTDDSDFLNGGGGDDSILVGSGDFVTGGDGADDIVLGDWLTSGEAAHILDYTAIDDNIVLIWDDSAADSAEPQITLTADPDSDDQTLVMMDGMLVATVNGLDLVPGDIALIPLSTATQVGLGA